MLFGVNLMKVFWFVLVFVDMEMNFLILFKVGFFCILLFKKKIISCLFCVFCIFFIVYIYWFYNVIYIKFFMIVFIELC